MNYQRAIPVLCSLVLALSSPLAIADYLAFSVNETAMAPCFFFFLYFFSS